MAALKGLLRIADRFWRSRSNVSAIEPSPVSGEHSPPRSRGC
jgi:hypothetical protein